MISLNPSGANTPLTWSHKQALLHALNDDDARDVVLHTRRDDTANDWSEQLNAMLATTTTGQFSDAATALDCMVQVAVSFTAGTVQVCCQAQACGVRARVDRQ